MMGILQVLQVLQDTPVPSLLVAGGLIFLLFSFVRRVGDVEIEPRKRGVAGVLGMILLLTGISLYVIPSPQALSAYGESETPSATLIPSSTLQVVAQPTGTLPRTSTLKVPTTAEEAASLFEGPPASEWKPCPQEPVGCWMFILPGSSYRVSVPEYCLRPDGSIDGWRYGGGYPDAPDAIEGQTRIWNALEAAVIRCRSNQQPSTDK